MSYNLESDVTKALEKLLETEANYDVIFRIGEEPNFKEFHAHSNFLSCRSNYLNTILSAKNIEKENGKYIIREPNITPQVFNIIIKYLYTGQINITNKTGDELLDIMIASNDLELNTLTDFTEDLLIKDYQRYLRNNSTEILQIFFNQQTFNKIKEFCMEAICFEPEILFNSAKFVDLPAPLLGIILKRNDLNLIEIEIWENLIKWGIAQEETLNDDKSKWNQEEFNTLEGILHRFIPLVRFYNIPSKDYVNGVKPYEEILSKELRDEIYKFYMTSGYKPTLNVYTPRYSKRNINSNIINQNHVAIFASWIDKKERNSMYTNATPYEFNRIFNTSWNGFSPASFHDKCNNKGANIVVIKIKNSNQIVGGYNPLDWNGVGWKNTADSFIFSFDDYRNVETGQIGRVIRKQCAVQGDPMKGPGFGTELVVGKSDGTIRYVQNDPTKEPVYVGYSTYSNIYPDIDIPTNFMIENYEVFQIKKQIISHSLKGSFISTALKSFIPNIVLTNKV
ncbi:hypothetical protein C1645_818609 [Glomus cerebriforme]|uniref:BTB/POZ domain-containing protein n=1 Tax=Glomus cerebriforme TaxID=658196 RepID=A0A397TAT8_9GLOM|nr:hypothetical protein C1645_818609 [Glomus cerebriforme]